eukprot:TRINITY_DN5209_c0_g1_i1.p1 TRINITY_DN5209_c0_g1~~TRINITY_DN5209_c0_g1_i1.p1  ORF type:complete len:1235 (-),score=181.18 TRINITY_DN5209_c0_g1_i1:275-3979(-)
MLNSLQLRVVHPTVTCDLCSTKVLTGPRLVCLNCANFDVCHGCYYPGRMAHPEDHVFLLLRVQASDFSIMQPCRGLSMQAGNTTHQGVTCDLCRRGPIQGIRLKCCTCDDYDVCMDCLPKLADPTKHPMNHAFAMLPRRSSEHLGSPTNMASNNIIPRNALAIVQTESVVDSHRVSDLQLMADSGVPDYKHLLGSIQVGDAVRLSPNMINCPEVTVGPLRPGILGRIIRLTDDELPCSVETADGRIGFYSYSAIEAVARSGAIVTIDNVCPGLAVVRGPRWPNSDKRGLLHEAGVLVAPDSAPFTWKVVWPDGSFGKYSVENGVGILSYAHHILSPLLDSLRPVRVLNYAIPAPNNNVPYLCSVPAECEPAVFSVIHADETECQLQSRQGVGFVPTDAIVACPRAGELVTSTNARKGFFVTPSDSCKLADYGHTTKVHGVIVEVNSPSSRLCRVRWNGIGLTESVHRIGDLHQYELIYDDPPFNRFADADSTQFDENEYVVLKDDVEANLLPQKSVLHPSNVGIVRKADHLRGLYLVESCGVEEWYPSKTLKTHLPIAVTLGNLVVGAKVCHFAKGQRETADPHFGSSGTILKSIMRGYVSVQWTPEKINNYQIGARGIYQLFYSPESYSQTSTNWAALSSNQIKPVKVGDLVTLHSDFEADGPLHVGEVGEIIEMVPGSRRLRIKTPQGHCGWYSQDNFVQMGLGHEGEPTFWRHRPLKLRIGDKVTVLQELKIWDDAWNGPLKKGDVGIILDVDHSHKGYLVQATNKMTWWYMDGTLTRLFDSVGDTATENSGNSNSPTPPNNTGISSSVTRQIEEGSRVVLSPNYETFDDAGGGPLRPGDVGVVIKDDKSSKPYQVRAPQGQTWWYVAGALVLAEDGKVKSGPTGPVMYIPSLSTVIREGVAVMLAEGYESCFDAINGPLRPGKTGVVVRCDGSSKPYLVRIETGVSWWYGSNAVVAAIPSTPALETQTIAPTPPAAPQPPANVTPTPAAVFAPRPSSTSTSSQPITQGSSVMLAPNYASCDDASGGPLRPGEVGIVIQDDRSSKPYQVRAPNGTTWWYIASALVPADSTAAAPSLPVSRSEITEGSKVILVTNYHDFDDASGGPLRPGDVGVVIQNDGSSKPFQVKAPNGSTWWYVAAALRLADGESVRDAVPSAPTGVITEGSQVILSANYRHVGDAANGPLSPGVVGVVVRDDRSSVPYQVRSPDGKTWWYRADALVLSVSDGMGANA